MSEDDNQVPSALVAVGTKALAVRSETLVKRGLALAKSLPRLESGPCADRPPQGPRKLSPEEEGEIVEWVRKTTPVEPHSHLGVALEHKGDWKERYSGIPRGAALEPEDDEAHYNLGVALGHKGDMDAAIAEYREALRLNPNNETAHMQPRHCAQRQG